MLCLIENEKRNEAKSESKISHILCIVPRRQARTHAHVHTIIQQSNCTVLLFGFDPSTAISVQQVIHSYWFFDRYWSSCCIFFLLYRLRHLLYIWWSDRCTGCSSVIWCNWEIAHISLYHSPITGSRNTSENNWASLGIFFIIDAPHPDNGSSNLLLHNNVGNRVPKYVSIKD